MTSSTTVFPRGGRRSAIDLGVISQRQLCCTSLKTNCLLFFTLLSIILGTCLGIGLRYYKEDWTEREVMYIGFVGDLFIRLLRGLMIPLIVSSLISAIGSVDTSISRRIGWHAAIHYLFTTSLAVIMGIILVTLIQPGKNTEVDIQRHGDHNHAHHNNRHVEDLDAILDVLRNLFPGSLMMALTHTYATTRDKDTGEWHGIYIEGSNILGITSYSIVMGFVIGKLKERGLPLLNFSRGLAEVMLIFTRWTVYVLPFGMFSLITAQFVGPVGDDLKSYFISLAKFVGTVVLGLTIQAVIITPLIFLILTKTCPFTFIRRMSNALFTAFITSSSAATIPVTLECLEEKNGVDPRVARLVIPMGAAMNMDGTALYEAVAAIWIAQILDYDLPIDKLIYISIIAVSASMGAAGIPEAGLVTTIMVLKSVGLPPEKIIYVVPVDWLLDRIRTVTNVLGDALSAGVIDHLTRHELVNIDYDSDLEDVFKIPKYDIPHTHLSMRSLSHAVEMYDKSIMETRSSMLNNKKATSTDDLNPSSDEPHKKSHKNYHSSSSEEEDFN